MIKINNSGIDYSQIIIETINKLFSMLFESLDHKMYSLLDTNIFINESILSNSLFSKVFNPTFGLPAIADALLIGFAIYYCFKLYTSHFSGNRVESPYQFIAKMLIIAICINFSSFICQNILNINNLLTESIRELGKTISGQEISFNNLIARSDCINNHSEIFNLFSLNGILESFFSFGLVNLLFSYSIRYIMVKIFILLSPFALLSLVTNSTSWIFKTWIRTFLSLLFVQVFVAFILMLLFSLNSASSDIFSQISYISTIFILSKANNYVKELFGGITTEINFSSFNLRNLIK